MGNLFSFGHKQPKEYRIIYFESLGQTIPITWPHTLDKLLQLITEIEGRTVQGVFFQDAVYRDVPGIWIASETSFQAIVPFHRDLKDIHVYYALMTLPR
jgi:hypothetical protein